MNKLDFFRAILLTNKEFEIPTTNKYIEYFINSIYCDAGSSKFFLTDEHEVAELYDKFNFSLTGLYSQSEYYGTTPYVIECKYDDDDNIVFSEIKTEDGKTIFKIENIEILPLSQSSITPFYKGIAITRDKNKKYGLINKYGEQICEPKFDEISSYPFNNYFIIRNQSKYQFVDLNGIVVVQHIYDYIIGEEDVYYGTTEGQIYGYVDDFLIVKLNERFGLLNNKLEQILPCEFKAIYAVEHEFSMHTNLVYFIVENIQNKYALLAPTKRIFTKFDWDDVNWDARKDVFPFRRENEYGFYFIKTKNEKIMNFPFDIETVRLEKPYFHIRHLELDKYAIFNDKFEQLTRFAFDMPLSITYKKGEYVFAERENTLGIKTGMSEKDFFGKFKI